MGIERLSKDQAGAICEHLDSEAEELLARPLGALRMPYLWIGTAHVKCRRVHGVASTAVVTAIGCDEDDWRRVLDIGVIDTEGYDSWLAFLCGVRSRGVMGVQLITSDAHEGLRRAIGSGKGAERGEAPLEEGDGHALRREVGRSRRSRRPLSAWQSNESWHRRQSTPASSLRTS